MPYKQEYPPLLPLGFHKKNIQQIRDLCVTQFKARGSQTREIIMQGLETLVDKLVKEGIECDIWVDGSFVTEKIDPADVDILVLIKEEFYDNATPSQYYLIKLVDSNFKAVLGCDSYVWRERKDETGEWWRAYWLRQFGFDRKDAPKGLPVITLP